MLPLLALLAVVRPQAPADPPSEAAPELQAAPAGAELRGERNEGSPPGDLTALSLEELMDLEVTIASRTEQPLSDAPAAVYVITGEELRRSGHASIQEALRMVPGFQVARFDSSGWAVTARGFSGAFSNQLLVMIDGVNVYTPLYAGVWWHLWDMDLADVERIEIVRGPGASLWGANAVNGVVHVITKHARDTQGLALNARAGTEELLGSARYGGTLGESGWYRVWLEGSDHAAMVDSLGESADFQDWQTGRVGFRGDFELGQHDRLRTWGRTWTASIGETYFVAFPSPPSVVDVYDETPKNGALWSTRWEHEDAGGGGSTALHAWYLRDFQKQVDFEIAIDIFDLDIQRQVPLSEDLDLLYGLGYRFVGSDLPGDFTYLFDPEEREDHTVRAFARGEWRASEDLRLIAGAGLEHNEFTGFEYQPDLRALWTPHPDHTVWAAASRAVRTPSLQENGLVFNIPIDDMGTYVTVLGSPDFHSEETYDFELGWRWSAAENVALDLTAFYADYDELQTFEDGEPFTTSYGTVFPVYFGNLADAISYGAEAALDWNPSARWRLRAAYTFFYIDSEIEPESTELTFPETDGASPRHQANLRSYCDLGEDWELDLGLYFVDDLPYFENPSYLRGDLRLGYRPSESLRLVFGAQNLFDPQHPEQGGGIVGAGSEVERAFYVGLSWHP